MDIFKINLAVLEQHKTELARLMKSIRLPEDRYRLLSTQSKLPTLEVKDSSGNSVLWHSRYDPSREVERDLANIDHSRIYIPMLSGIGLGYTLRELWNRYRNEFFDALIIEYDPHIFYMAMCVTRLDDIFSDPRLHIYLGPHLENWPLLVRSIIPSIMSSKLQVLPHNQSQRCYAPFYEKTYELLTQQICLASAEFDLMIRSGPRIQENLLLNIPPAIDSYGIVDFRGFLKSKPVVVVAAGPSLDKNVDLLKNVEDSITIIAVDTALRTLKQHGIDPHFVVSTDPTELNIRHFDELTLSPLSILAFDPEVFHSIPNNWPGKRLFLNLKKTALTRWLEEVCGPYDFIEKGGSVGHTAFFLAREMGADPIILVGLDLAFQPGGGETHASVSALSRRYEAIPNGSTAATLGPRAGSKSMEEKIVWVPGLEGGLVPTSQVMALYIRQFCDEFKRTDDTIIDATEGGALIEGTQVCSLKQALEMISSSTNELKSLFQSLTAKNRDISVLIHELERIIHLLKNSFIEAQRGLELSQILSSYLDEGIEIRQRPEWIEMENKFNLLYQSADLKVALEQALFSALYQFVQKEPPDQVALRLSKYRNFFQAFIYAQPHFLNVLEKVKSEILASG